MVVFNDTYVIGKLYGGPSTGANKDTTSKPETTLWSHGILGVKDEL